MITPAEIGRKAALAYPKMLTAFAQGTLDSMFPMRVRAELSLNVDNISATIAAVERLRSASKGQTGSGYTIKWKQTRLRDFGNNFVPEEITFDSIEDLVSIAGKRHHFAATRRVAECVRDKLPELSAWLKTNVRRIADYSEYLDGLILVAKFFMEHPWPDCYARQIPVPVDTKFVDRHRAILREWLDELLDASAVQSDESRFELRFGLRDGQPYTTIRVLDTDIQAELGLPFEELSLPLRSLESLAIRDKTVVIVENQLNLLTLPRMKDTLAIRGEGKAVTRLHRLKWLSNNDVLYWGDIDVDGFQILSSLRTYFPNVRSLLMTDAVLGEHAGLILKGNGGQITEPANLNGEELAAFHQCRLHNHRLEQERLPQSYVDRLFAQLRQ